MLQLALLLMGANFVRKSAPVLAIIGVLWGGLGVTVFMDGLEGMRYFPFHVFGLILLAESLVTLFLAGCAAGAKKSVVDSIDQCNIHAKTWGSGGLLNEAYIYGSRKRVCFRLMEERHRLQ